MREKINVDNDDADVRAEALRVKNGETNGQSEYVAPSRADFWTAQS